jgi:hypothetical protein
MVSRVERPDAVAHRRIVRVDQQRAAGVVLGFGVAGEMDLADMAKRESVEISDGIEAVIGRGDDDVVDVEQQAAAGAAGDLGEEVGLGHHAFREEDVGRRIFEQHASPDRLLRLVDVVANRLEGLFRIGQRQQIVEEALVVGRPGEMFGEQARLIACGEPGEPLQMRFVERPRRADREADAVQRQRIARADRLEPAVRRAAVAHVIFRMNLEKSEVGSLREDRVDMLGLEADARAGGQGRGDARRLR